ncbi:hypothetical protein BJV78DRAFT_1151590 [Lactifluus subvellereus]|nr:hypothetical protein BJV78DRAFT_1151590 [Lactifluus subvellereus]
MAYDKDLITSHASLPNDRYTSSHLQSQSDPRTSHRERESVIIGNVTEVLADTSHRVERLQGPDGSPIRCGYTARWREVSGQHGVVLIHEVYAYVIRWYLIMSFSASSTGSSYCHPPLVLFPYSITTSLSRRVYVKFYLSVSYSPCKPAASGASPRASMVALRFSEATLAVGQRAWAPFGDQTRSKHLLTLIWLYLHVTLMAEQIPGVETTKGGWWRVRANEVSDTDTVTVTPVGVAGPYVAVSQLDCQAAGFLVAPNLGDYLICHQATFWAGSNFPARPADLLSSGRVERRQPNQGSEVKLLAGPVRPNGQCTQREQYTNGLTSDPPVPATANFSRDAASITISAGQVSR